MYGVKVYIVNREHAACVESHPEGFDNNNNDNQSIAAMKTQSDIVRPSIGQNTSCQSTEYTCVSDRSCIDRNLTCNARNDCFDGSDEISCPFTGINIMYMNFIYNNIIRNI